jgi:CRISPR-associated protein Cas1
MGLEWNGRKFDRNRPEDSDLPNQAINGVVMCVEALATVAVQATGTIAQLGFIHEDSTKSWLLDVCDLYRTTVTVPLAFKVAKEFPKQHEMTMDRAARRECVAHFKAAGLIDRMIDDIKEVLA